jgi:tetratricopeptide (TPR) repeat protein
VRHRLSHVRAALAAFLVFVVTLAIGGAAAAQTGRVVGIVKDESGQPIKGATVAAENPDASPRSLTATTDDKGRFAMIGLRSGIWMLTVQAPGFLSQGGELPIRAAGAPSLNFSLKVDRAAAAFARARGDAKELQTELLAADQLYHAAQWDEAIKKYQAIWTRTPPLVAVNLQIGQAYRNKAADAKARDPRADVRPLYDQALTAYQGLLKADPTNARAKLGIAMTTLEQGDLPAAERMLDEAAHAADATTEVFYGLGEVKKAEGNMADATKAYERAAQMDPDWGKPMFALAQVALNEGDKARALSFFERVVAVDPVSPEAAQSAAMVEQLKK